MEAVLHKNRLLNIVLGVDKAPNIGSLPRNPTNEQRAEFEEKMEVLQRFIEKDMDARAEILIALEPNIVNTVRNIKTSSEMWKHLQDTYDRKTTRTKN